METLTPGIDLTPGIGETVVEAIGLDHPYIKKGASVEAPFSFSRS
jgi:hypothetical protein